MAVTPGLVAPADADAVTGALRAQLAGLPARSPFYADLFAEHGISPEDFSSLADIARFPFTGKQMLRDSQAAAPPLGRHAGVDMTEVVRVAKGELAPRTPLVTGVVQAQAGGAAANPFAPKMFEKKQAP